MDALNATLTVENKNSEFWLVVDETPFEELPKFIEQVEVPDIAHSTVDEFYGNNV